MTITTSSVIAANTSLSIPIAFNSIYSSLTDSILNDSDTGYGILPKGSLVTTSTNINPEDWQSLLDDLDKITIHQTGESIPVDAEDLPTLGQPLRARLAQALATAASNATNPSNLYSVAPSQLASAEFTSDRPTTWGAGSGGGISFITVNIWADEITANQYFNLGGYFKSEIGFTPGTGDGPYSDEELLVQQLISDYKADYEQPFDRQRRLDTIQYHGGVTATTHIKTITDGLNTGTFTATVVYQVFTNHAGNDSLRTTVELIPDSTDTYSADLHLDVISTTTRYYAISGGIGGIDAVVPTSGVTMTFEGSDAYVVPRAIRTLSFDNTHYDYTFTGGSTSAPQNIIITNSILDPVTAATATITAINLTDRGATPSFSPSAPFTIQPGASQTVSLNWSKPTITAAELGSFKNTFTVKSNNTKGDITVPINVVVTKPDATFSITPSTPYDVLSSLVVTSKTFTISPNFGEIKGITAAITGHSNFKITKQPTVADPTVTITYTPQIVADNTYSVTLTASVTLKDIAGITSGVTNSTTWSIEQAITDTHLGSWISAQGPFNSVVGASYDIIDGQTYITLGVGMGADGSPIIDKHGGSYANVSNLGLAGVSSNYKYWAEVYRIPITEGNGGERFFSSNYLVKDTKPANDGKNKYADYFQSNNVAGHLFYVLHDGKGNVEIRIGQPNGNRNISDSITIGSLYYSFYYFETAIPRYTHLSPEIRAGGYSQYFKGFKKVAINQAVVYTDSRSVPTPAHPETDNDWVEQAITFFVAGFFTDLLIIETGLFQVMYLDGAITNTSLGVWILDAVGVDVMGNTTVGGFLVDKFTLYADSLSNSIAPYINDAIGGAKSLYIEAQKSLSSTAATFGSAVTAADLAAANATADPIGTLAYIKGWTDAEASVAISNVATTNATLGEAAATAAKAGGLEVGLTLTETLGYIGAAVLIIDGLQTGNAGKVAGGAAIIAILTGWCCFTGDTEIKLADGTTKKISEFTSDEEVMNWDGSAVNRVRFQIARPNYVGALCSLDDSVPFISFNHPLIIDGKVSSFDAGYVHVNYPWLGECEQIRPAHISKSDSQTVYNLLVDGDGTYMANGVGASSGIGDGGIIVDLVRDGKLPRERALAILRKYHDMGGAPLHHFYKMIKDPSVDPKEAEAFINSITTP